jgi:DNA-binding IclR family transcriptional regulator
VPIGIEELCHELGFTAPAVYRALHELVQLQIIERFSGGGRKQKNSYFVNDPEQWLCRH